MEEVQCSVFSMVPLKALVVDGIHAKFYQANWDIVGSNVYKLVRHDFSRGVLDPRLNRTLMVFILKRTDANSINPYRPISLGTILYNFFAKTIVV